eukprot:CAMPEP_0183423578 /NCGR_PEP_ID=MMETSP0370-20130417/28587_1 /TAXON_ID=268820 /ORGANISM="Peridinium aciculiferum, Strain PAER-2" /LENGTH=126 /DNA_ID=CAMNT_0025607777 /DNA_START=67 /DNA_END=447 /DNA_ORIENTATION=+
MTACSGQGAGAVAMPLPPRRRCSLALLVFASALALWPQLFDRTREAGSSELGEPTPALGLLEMGVLRSPQTASIADALMRRGMRRFLRKRLKDGKDSLDGDEDRRQHYRQLARRRGGRSGRGKRSH